MNRKVKKVVILVFVIWVVLWGFFLVREDKDGQYAQLKRLYQADSMSKARVICGDELYAFVTYCSENIPKEATYGISGFDQFAIDEVRLKYYLWPREYVDDNAEYLLYYKQNKPFIKGYSKNEIPGVDGYVFKKT
jgi:hypothetical protein